MTASNRQRRARPTAAAAKAKASPGRTDRMKFRRFMTTAIALSVLAAVSYHYLEPQYVVNAPPRRGPIVAFGDSLTAGFGAEKYDLCYPEQLSYIIGVPVLNKGVSGDTIADGAGRLDRDVIAQHPGIVLLCLGGNDYLKRKNLDQSFRDLAAIIDHIQEDGAMVVLIGIDGLLPIGGFGGKFRKLAQEKGCVYVPDALDGILGHDSLMHDHIHPNGAGYKIFAKRVAKAVEPYI